MNSTVDEIQKVIPESYATLVAAIIGVFGALLGVAITFMIENHRRRKELVDKAKPIMINYLNTETLTSRTRTPYLFVSDGKSKESINGTFKNTDNGILFLDYIKTETKTYMPKHVVAIDKNTVFEIMLRGLQGETLKECKFYCHDIYGNKYYYNALFTTDLWQFNQISILDGEPTRISNKNPK